MSETKQFLKPVLTGAIAGLANKFYLNETVDKSSLIFGGSVAAGIYASQFLAPMVPNVGNIDGMMNGKTLGVRIAEIGLGAGSAYAVNKYVFKNDRLDENMLMKVGVIAGADFIAEYITDYITGQPLDFLSSGAL